MTARDEQVSRSELALIIRAAAEAQSRRPGEDTLSLDEAERVAAEVGIPPAEFRAAVRSVRAKRPGARGFLGPSGVMSTESTLPRAVAGEEACQLLAEGQVSMALAGAPIERVGDHVWRLGQSGRGGLQVTTRGDETRISAVSDSRKTKAALLAVPAVGGAVAGTVVLSGIAFAAVGTPEALALSNVLGTVGGSLLGFAGGRVAWTALARRTRERMDSAIERMRELAGTRNASDVLP